MRFLSFRRVSIAAAIVLGSGMLTTSAHAQVIPIAPFAGDLLETWESRNNYTTPSFHHEPNPTDIFGGAASIAGFDMGIYEPGVAPWGLVDNGQATVADGTKGMGLDSPNDTVTITFAGTVSQFGAFWCSGRSVDSGLTDDIAITFFDSSNAVIDAFSFDASPGNDNAMTWFGWSSPTPIKSISYTGTFSVIDSLRATSVIAGAGAPEPGALALLSVGIGVLGLTRRRRRTR